jgi:folylpolyglutamate synthase/dihydropteroate synthase
MSAEKLVELAHRMGKPAMAVTPVEKAVEDAVGMLGPDTVLVAAGSLFVAAAVRETWQNMGQTIRSFEMAEYK